MMKHKTGAIYGVISVALLCICSASKCAIGGTAFTTPHTMHVASKTVATSKPASSVIPLPAMPFPRSRFVPRSVALSPNGRWLAVLGDSAVLIYDVRANHWIKTLKGEVYPPLRWHPSKPILIFGSGSDGKPRFYKGSISGTAIRSMFRSDPWSIAWTASGLINSWGVIDLARSGEGGVRVRNFGYPIPWAYNDKRSVLHIASGPHDEVAAEVGVVGKGGCLETYRKVPGSKQWIRVGQIIPRKGEQIQGKASDMNPAFLPNGEITYLKTYRKSIAHEDGAISPGLYELWASSLDGKKQRRLAVLRDLYAFADWRSDWYAVDWPKKTIYYLSGEVVRRMKLTNCR